MDPLSKKTNPNVPINSETQIPQDQPAGPAKLQQGVSDTQDSIEAAKVDSFREAYLAGRSESKVLMSDATLNHVLQARLTPKQYPEAFKDLKGWVRTNFALTPDQNATLNLLSDGEVRKFQDAAALAATLDKPLYYQSHDPDPSLPGPCEMKFQDAVVKDNGVFMKNESSRPQLPTPELPNLNKVEP